MGFSNMSQDTFLTWTSAPPLTTNIITNATITTAILMSPGDSGLATTSTATATVTTTTSTGLRLFCFSFLHAHGNGTDLMKKQLEKGVGIYSCDDWMVLSYTEIELAQQPSLVTTTAISPRREGA